MFSQAFAKRAPRDIRSRAFGDRSQLADLAITQFVIEDGWVGVALAPQQATAHHGLLQR